MTVTATGTSRLLGPSPSTPLPSLGYGDLLTILEDAGLTGRGGAGFPTYRKLAAVSGAARRATRPVVVGNAMEGEFLSHKDKVLLGRNPGLVIDGLEVLGRALGAKRLILAVGPDIDPGPARSAAHGRRVEVEHLDGGFVAGQESALVNRLDGGPGIPSDPLVPVWRRGVDGRPTMVSNAETLAQVALVARYGAAWFRSQGTDADPGTFLATVTGSSTQVVGTPGVIEIARGTPLRAALERTDTDLAGTRAVLVGGYHGAWVPIEHVDVALSRAGLASFNASPGAGVLHVLDSRHCPLSVSAAIAEYLAGESARQCGPCVNGLPRIADTMTRLSRPGSDPRLAAEVERLRGLVVGRGACAHPDGTARFIGSTMRVFADHVSAHVHGRCAG